MDLIILILSALAAVLILIFSLSSRYRRCPSDRILVVYGKIGGTGSAKCYHGGAAFIIPILQAHQFLDLEPMTMDINLTGALSKQNIRVNCPSTFTVGISTESGVMENAAERNRRLKRGEADGIRSLTDADADRIQRLKEAEAAGIEAILKKKADGFDRIVDAIGGADNAALLLATEQLPKLVEEQVKAIAGLKIDNVTVWDAGRGENGKTATADFVSGLVGSLPPLHELTKNVGIKLPEYLGAREGDEGTEERSTPPEEESPAEPAP